jgi:hypothetical protein
MSGRDTDRESGTLLPPENYDAEAAAAKAISEVVKVKRRETPINQQ